MKKIIVMLLLATVGAAAHAQKMRSQEVPASVKDSFAKRFRNVQHVKWSKEDDNSFEAEFKTNEKEQSATFDANGTWLETETEVSESSLPQAVTTTLSKEFAGYKIEEAEWTETANGSYYEVEVEKGEQSMEVQISKDGKILKREEKKERDHKHSDHSEHHGDRDDHDHEHHRTKKS